MSNTYYNNDSGGESFDNSPPEPMGGANAYVDSPYDITNITEGGMGGDPLDVDGGFLEGRPREGAEGVDITRDTDTGEFSSEPASPGNAPLGLERGPDSERVGIDPYVVGNAGQFNSPYDSVDNEDKEEKYK